MNLIKYKPVRSTKKQVVIRSVILMLIATGLVMALHYSNAMKMQYVNTGEQSDFWQKIADKTETSWNDGHAVITSEGILVTTYQGESVAFTPPNSESRIIGTGWSRIKHRLLVKISTCSRYTNYYWLDISGNGESKKSTDDGWSLFRYKKMDKHETPSTVTEGSDDWIGDRYTGECLSASGNYNYNGQ